MSDKSSLHPIRDFTILTSIFTAFLYALGFIYENVFLELFYLDSAEFAPDVSTLVGYGFRYVFLNSTPAILFGCIVAFAALFCVNQVKLDFLVWLSKRDTLNTWVRNLINAVELRGLRTYFFLALPAVLIGIIFHAGLQAKHLAENVKAGNDLVEKLLVLKSNSKVEHVGKVIRMRNGLVAFWDRDVERSYVYNVKDVTLEYGIEEEVLEGSSHSEK